RRTRRAGRRAHRPFSPLDPALRPHRHASPPRIQRTPRPMKTQRKLSLPAIWNMSFGFLGIQFGWGLQMANMSPIYKYLGARDDQIPMLWLAAPLLGLL